MEQIFKVLGEKLKEQEDMIVCRDYTIKQLREENAKLADELKKTQQALADADKLLNAKANNAEGGY
jgi:hypothetical protein